MRSALKLAVSFCAMAAILALGACATAPDVSYADLEEKYADASSQFMRLDGDLRVHFRDHGPKEGAPIVLIHGFSASLHTWEPWVEKLSTRYRVVTLDLPGHGLTQAPADYSVSLDTYANVVDQVATKLSLGPYVAVGNSMGGGAAWTLALRRPDRLRGLVLVNSVAPPASARAGGKSLALRIAGTPPARAVLRRLDLRNFAERGLKTAYADPRLVTPAVVDRYVDMSRAPGHRDISLRGQGRGAEGIALGDLSKVQVPTLVMVGRQDRIIPPSTAEALAAAIPRARLISYAGVGHLPMEEVPDLSGADLDAFLASLSP